VCSQAQVCLLVQFAGYSSVERPYLTQPVIWVSLPCFASPGPPSFFPLVLVGDTVAGRYQHQAHQPNFVAAGQTHVNLILNSTTVIAQVAPDFLLQYDNILLFFVSELMDLLLTGEDQSQADQLNNLAEGHPM